MSAEYKTSPIADLDHGKAPRRHVLPPHRLLMSKVFAPGKLTRFGFCRRRLPTSSPLGIRPI
jgi:hypothetical protein